MAVPNIFGTATSAIPLSQLDTNFATPVTIGNTAVQLGNTVTSFGNVTLTNVTISSGNVTITGANVSGTANVSTLVVTGNQTSLGNVTVTGNVSANIATFSAGSNTAPSITTTGDTNTGIFFPAADTIAFAEGGAESMRIDSSGNLVLGTTSASGKFTISDNSGGAGVANTVVLTNGVDANCYLSLTGSSASDKRVVIGPSTGTAVAFQTNATERMRIDSSGIVQIGGTSARTTQAKLELTSATNTALSFYMYKTSQVEMAMGFKSSTDSNFYIGTGSTSVGTNGVYLTNTGSSWNSVSDERMKTIVEPIENAAEKVSSLRAVIGYYNNDESETRRPFLIAQDVQDVLPEAVNIQDVETGTLGMSYTDTIPLLVAAIKEQQALITALTARITALETLSAEGTSNGS